MATTYDLRSILIVVDPAQDKPLALERVLNTTRKAASGFLVPPKLYILPAVDCDNTDTSAENPAVYRNATWFFERIINPLQESGLEYSFEMSWSSDWYGSIISASEKLSPELIMLPLMSRPSGHERIFNESIWRLLRTAQSPVLVAKPESPQERKTILAAINIQSHKPEYQQLNDMIINRGQWLAASHDADLHIVNAYEDSLNYPDRAQLANKTQVDTANIHVKSGDPDDVIASVAKEIGADLVVLGTRKRSSRWRGNTSEKIVTRVACDILAIH